MNNLHELKTDPAVFAAVLVEKKTCEICKNDRGFAVGDTLLLRETVSSGYHMGLGAPLAYTGRTATRTIGHILTGYGLVGGRCILLFAAHPVADAGALYVPTHDLDIPALRDVPVQPEEIALNEWLDKTAWVQEQLSTFPAQSLGRHRADVMRDEIERLRLLEKTVLKDCIDEGCPFYGTAGVTCTPHPNGCTATAPSIPAQAGVPDGVALMADDITKVRRAKHRMVDALISSGVQYKKCGGISYHLERLIDSLAAQVQPVADGGEDA